MNYKLDNPVALKVINCMMIDKPVSVQKVVECSKLFNNDIRQTLGYCINHNIIKYKSALYIIEIYRKTFNDIIKNRSKELRMRNVMR